MTTNQRAVLVMARAFPGIRESEIAHETGISLARVERAASALIARYVLVRSDDGALWSVK